MRIDTYELANRARKEFWERKHAEYLADQDRDAVISWISRFWWARVNTATPGDGPK
jgi:hypothetical protein